MTHVNIEFKAKCPNPNLIREILKSKHAHFQGTDHQIDTYFNVTSGRLKLREGTIETALIFYERPDQDGPKQSDVLLHHPDPSRTQTLKDILQKTLGILVIVDKNREIYYVGNVKFHIDNVQGLGSFLEVEAIDTDGSIGVKKLQQQCDYYLQLFKVSPEDLIAESYSDLIMNC
ncbi:MAG: CYTH domain-containing protein [Candidatus Heimdallarchaeota archaeon]|nr:CYTH domain-containing protein [Candidatus Heimdallarchaeota archaeon]